jgi:hypothetical protein
MKNQADHYALNFFDYTLKLFNNENRKNKCHKKCTKVNKFNGCRLHKYYISKEDEFSECNICDNYFLKVKFD